MDLDPVIWETDGRIVRVGDIGGALAYRTSDKLRLHYSAATAPYFRNDEGLVTIGELKEAYTGPEHAPDDEPVCLLEVPVGVRVMFQGLTGICVESTLPASTMRIRL